MFQDEPWQPWQGWCPRTVHSVFACIFQNYKIYWHFQTSIVPKCRQQRFQPQETLLHLPHPAGRADNKYIERHHQNQTQQDPETTGNHIRVPTTTSWCLFSGRMCYSVVVTKRLFGGTFHFFEAIVGNTLQCCILLFHAVSVSLPVDIHWIVSFQTASSSSSNSSPSFEYMHQCCIKQKFRWSRVGHRAVTVCIHLGVKKNMKHYETARPRWGVWIQRYGRSPRCLAEAHPWCASRPFISMDDGQSTTFILKKVCQSAVVFCKVRIEDHMALRTKIHMIFRTKERKSLCSKLFRPISNYSYY